MFTKQNNGELMKEKMMGGGESKEMKLYLLLLMALPVMKEIDNTFFFNFNEIFLIFIRKNAKNVIMQNFYLKHFSFYGKILFLQISFYRKF